MTNDFMSSLSAASKLFSNKNKSMILQKITFFSINKTALSSNTFSITDNRINR